MRCVLAYVVTFSHTRTVADAVLLSVVAVSGSTGLCLTIRSKNALIAEFNLQKVNDFGNCRRCSFSFINVGFRETKATRMQGTYILRTH